MSDSEFEVWGRADEPGLRDATCPLVLMFSVFIRPGNLRAKVVEFKCFVDGIFWRVKFYNLCIIEIESL